MMVYSLLKQQPRFDIVIVDLPSLPGQRGTIFLIIYSSVLPAKDDGMLVVQRITF